MRVNRRLAVAMAGAVAVIGSVASVGLPAVSARAATTTTTVALPISSYSHMLLDPAHQHIFISSAASNTILVTDYSGQTVATIANEPGADGLAVSGDGSTVYAALSTGDAISAISTSTLAESARYATGTGTDPAYVAYAGGRIWFGYGNQYLQSGIGSIDPSTTPATVTLNATKDSSVAWAGAPVLTASPNGELVAGDPNVESTTMASYDVSSGTATVLAAPRSLNSAAYNYLSTGVMRAMQITPDGKDVVVATGAPYYHMIFQVSDLSIVGEYPTTYYPNSVSIASNGTVATGVDSGTPTVALFAPGGTTPLRTYSNFGAYLGLANDGLAITPDGSDLFAVTTDVYGNTVTLNIITDPVQGPSTLSVTGPATGNQDRPITLTGTLGGASPYAGGQTLQVTRTDPTHPNGVALPDVTTAADGSFTITDTPPKAHVDRATVTYKVSYAGDAYLTGSTASVSVTVHYNNS